ncbi:hypothetical protein ACRAWF_20555 [Streptomyces sp. L7]
MTVATPVRPAPAAPRALVRSVQSVPERHRRPPSPRGGLLSLAALLLGITAQLLVFSGAQEHSAQHAAFDELRGQLALGTAPVSHDRPAGQAPRARHPGRPDRHPGLGLSQVVLEGTDSAVLTRRPRPPP